MSTSRATARVRVSVNQLVTNLALSEIKIHRASCPVCHHYLLRRGSVVFLAVTVEATRRDLVPTALLARYLRSVHARHLAGMSLSTRKRTPDRTISGRGRRITVQRSCNGCQASLGDANTLELDAAVEGRPLPDVRLECGCWTAEAAA